MQTQTLRIVCLLLAAQASFAISPAFAVEIKGKVTEANNNTVRITIAPEILPNVGDPVEIYFEIPGIDEQVSVGTGKVTEVGANFVVATISSANAKVTKNQFARINSAAPRRPGAPAAKTEVTPKPPASTTRPATPPATVRPTPPIAAPASRGPAKVGLLLSLPAQESGLSGLAFSADGSRALVFANGFSEWDLASGKLLRQFPVVGGAYCATFSGDRTRMLTGTDNGDVRLWDVASGKELRRYGGHTTTVGAAAFSRDGRFIATGAGATNLRDAQGRAPGPGAGPDFQAFTEDCTVRVWEVETGREMGRMEGHKSPVASVVFSPNALYVLSASADRSIRLWDVRNGAEVQRFLETRPLGVLTAVLAPDALTLVSLSGGATGMLEETEPLAGGPTGRSSDIPAAAANDGPPIGRPEDTMNAAFQMRLWDQGTSRELRVFLGHSQEILCVAFSPDGRRLLSGSADRTVRLWDAKTGAQLARFDEHKLGVSHVAFSLDGRHALSADMGNTIKLWGLPE